MVETDRSVLHATTVLWRVLVGILVIYIVFTFMPFFVVKGGFTNIFTKVESAQYKEALSRIGTYGDSFGALNAFFTSMALVGLIYTAYLQRIQIDRQFAEIAENKIKERELRIFEMRRDLMNAANHLAQSYVSAYSMNMHVFDAEYDAMVIERKKVIHDKTRPLSDRDAYDLSNTVKGKALFYRNILEQEYSSMNNAVEEFRREALVQDFKTGRASMFDTDQDSRLHVMD